MNYLRNIGKSLMMPVAVLPAAAILAGLGNWLVTIGVIPVIANILFMSGTAILDNMAMLFAIGLAYGLSKDKNGAAVLPAIVIWFIVFNLLKQENLVTLLGIEKVDGVAAADLLGEKIGVIQALSFAKLNNAFLGIMIGIISSVLYNRFSDVELPAALSFFSGRRLVPIIGAVVAIVFSGILFVAWPILFNGLVVLGENIQKMGPAGAGIYGFLNRLLIPTGLHHALNAVFWFDIAGINDIGNYLGCTANNFDAATGICKVKDGVEAVKGTTGMYQAGFFPIMMFGLPAGALAMYQAAIPENRKKVGSILLAGAFASFFTGVTEPLEFSFMFVAFPLYVIHALLTGLSLFIASLFQFVNGFGFSAGFVDYVLNFVNPLANQPILLLVQGLVFAALYYFIFKFAIAKFNIMTPGRIAGEFDEVDGEGSEESSNQRHAVMAEKIAAAVGVDNIVQIDNCATRLRLEIKDSSIIDEAAIKKAGTAGIVKPTKTQVQIIIGPTVEFVAKELKKITDK
ncbi:MAG: N-acetylglucosamine-specific PTS transporter subunit IIBC [Mycoplasmatales bacterium]